MRKVIGILFMILLSGCIRFGKDTTDTIYLIPEAYEGDLLVLYNVPGGELLPEEDGFRVVTFSADGTGVTSTANMKYGEVNDTYYTVNKERKRTKLDEGCIRVGSNEALLKTLVKKMSILSHTRNWKSHLVYAHKAFHHTGEKYQNIQNIQNIL